MPESMVVPFLAMIVLKHVTAQMEPPNRKDRELHP